MQRQQYPLYPIAVMLLTTERHKIIRHFSGCPLAVLLFTLQIHFVGIFSEIHIGQILKKWIVP